MILERALFTIKPELVGDFAAAFAQARKHIESAQGFRKLEMRHGLESPQTFLLLVWWATLDDHIKGFRDSDAFTQWRAILGPLFASPPAVEHYDAAL